MQKNIIDELYKELEMNLTNKSFLKQLKMSKKSILEILKLHDWKTNIEKVLRSKYSCLTILEVSKDTLDNISEEPAKGWFAYIEECTLNVLFPQNYSAKRAVNFERGRLVLLEILRTFLRDEKYNMATDPLTNMIFLSKKEAELFTAGEEYNKFTTFCRVNYIYEFMRVGRETTPYNILGHISGVHFVAMHIARQLHKAGVAIDLSLVSGAAAGHDIGKFGCKPEEAKRIPYLHYYYTDEFFKRNKMPVLGHTATNHSTWDLELENLSVESLVLIYADFRVKGTMKETKEDIHIYTLKDSFHVILNKLDNVDEAKRNRYIHVYDKLYDFESYMESLGVNTELEESEIKSIKKKDPSLFNSQEVVEKLKYLAIEHNIFLMNKLNGEASLSSIIEAARSEKNWKNIRAYINIFQEYFTYLTKKQKEITLNYLYELLMHREGDIRRQAADLMGNIIVNYDEEHRKEMPEGAVREPDEVMGIDLWSRTLQNIIYPDHKVTEQHKRWLGYTLKVLVDSVLRRCKREDEEAFIKALVPYYSNSIMDNATSFILVDSLGYIPLKMCGREDIETFISFLSYLTSRNVLEINIAILRFLKYNTENPATKAYGLENVKKILENIDVMETTCGVYLISKIYKNLKGLIDPSEIPKIDSLKIYSDGESTSAIFLENLKTATPWIVKAVNIELLLDQINSGNTVQLLHVATHFSNLIKVSERVAVRHSAGQALIEIMPVLSLDQRNEVVIELTKGLEIGEYEISKYIPQYLGQLAMFLHPDEIDEFVGNLTKLFENTNERVGSVALNTIGILMENYPRYRDNFNESEDNYIKRRERILGMLLRGLANYNEVVSQEAFLVMGEYIFGSKKLTLQEKYDVFKYVHKKMLTLFIDQEETDLSFFNNAAALNHVYRFISNYIFQFGTFDIPQISKVAFFPGTFDPFSLSHKGIVKEIRNKGFEVHLALDEFSWSKKTQPRIVRRKIINMSVADINNVYLFPDDMPVNIANTTDIKNLIDTFSDREVYIVVGSDVIINASSYKAEPQPYSIHCLNHVVFRRDSISEGEDCYNGLEQAYKSITGKIEELKLPVHLEDISSTRIRENIDLNRDISNLIDTVAQNYIYDNSMYLREPQYKHILKTKSISFEIMKKLTESTIEELRSTILKDNENIDNIVNYMKKKGVMAVIVRDGEMDGRPAALSLFSHVATANLYDEFKNVEISEYVREKASGKILVIGGIYKYNQSKIYDLIQLVLTETIAYSLARDFGFAVYNDISGVKDNAVISVMERQGFQKLDMQLEGKASYIYTVDMKSPVMLTLNIDTTIKEPLNRSRRILNVMESTHKKLQRAITKLYPGNLILTINSNVMHHRLIDRITEANNVPKEPLVVRRLGGSMCVPFGKILRGMAVPNTVTKALHTEKIFDPEIESFQITNFPYYSPLINQVKTIKSFNRPVILVDDLLHKGYRIKKLDPLFKEENVKIDRIIVGVLSGKGKDLMTIRGRKVESVYFIPNLKSWFVESTMYPFIGGDSISRKKSMVSNLLVSINLMLPYVAPVFLNGVSKKALYDFSMACLENARDMLEALEAEYQEVFEKNLTLNRLSEAVISPRIPDKGVNMQYDMNLPPSDFIKNDIEALIRLKDVILN